MTGRGRIVLSVCIAAVLLIPVAAAMLYVSARQRAEHPYGEVDGVLWRQVARSFDPLKSSVFSQEHLGLDARLTSVEYIGALRGESWDGDDASASRLGLTHGSAVIYDVDISPTTASFSAFISSGPRPDVPTDRGDPYFGPSTLYTCLRIQTLFSPDAAPSVLFDVEHLDCPSALRAQLPADAQYADPQAFDG